MKKSIIFFLMVFLYLGNYQARSESTVFNADIGKTLSGWDLLNSSFRDDGQILGITGLNQVQSIYPGYITGTYTDPEHPDQNGELLPAVSPFNIAINGHQTRPFLTYNPIEEIAPFAPYLFHTMEEEEIAQLIWIVNGAPIASGVQTFQFPSNMPVGEYEIYVARNYNNGFTRLTESFIINVLENFVVNITGPETACLGEVVTMTAHTDGPNVNYTYQWMMDGQYLPGEIDQMLRFSTDTLNGRHDFEAVVSTDGCDAEHSNVIRFNTLDSTHILVDASTDYVCGGGEFTLSAVTGTSDNANFQFRWYQVTGLDGNIEESIEYLGLGESITITAPQEPGVYYYTAKINNINNDGCEVTTEVVTVTVTGPISVEINSTGFTFCEGNPIHLWATVTGVPPGTPITYTWYENEVLIENANMMEIHRYHEVYGGTTNQYQYRVEVTIDGTNCSAISSPSTQIDVVPTPTLGIFGEMNYCLGDEIVLTAVGIPHLEEEDAHYTWFVNYREQYGFNEETFVLLTDSVGPGVHTVTARRTTGSSAARICETNTEDYFISVFEAIPVHAEVDNNVICAGGEVTLSAILEQWDADGVAYQWYLDEVLIEGATEPTYTTILGEGGTFEFQVKIDEIERNCQGESNIVKVNVVAYPEVEISSNVDAICDGGAVILTSDIEFYDEIDFITPSYTWYRNNQVIEGAVLGQIIDFPFDPDGDHNTFVYNLVVEYNLPACVSTISNTIEIDLNPNPTVYVDGEQIVCEGMPIELIANVDNYDPNTGELIYKWNLIGEMFNDLIDWANDTVKTDDYLTQYDFAFPIGFFNSLSSMYQENYVESYDNTQIFPGTYSNSGLPNALSFCILNNATSLRSMYSSGQNRVSNNVQNEAKNVAQEKAQDVKGEITAILSDLALSLAAENALTHSEDETRIDGSHADEDMLEDVDAAIAAIQSVLLDAATYNYQYSNVSPYPLTYVPASEWFCGPTDYHAQQIAAYRHGYNYKYWTTYDAAFKAAYINALNELDLTSYLNQYGLTFNENFEVIYYNTIPVGVDIDSSYFVINDLPARDRPYQFIVTVSNDNGCITTSDIYEVTVKETVEVAITVDHPVICDGAEVIFTGHLSDYNRDRFTFQWFLNGEPIEGAFEIEYITTPHEGEVYTLLVTDLDGRCTMFGTAPEIEFVQIEGEILALNVASNSHSICDGAQVDVFAYVVGEDGETYLDETLRYEWRRNGFLMPLVTGPHFSESLMTVDGDTTIFVYEVRIDVPGCYFHNFHGADTVTVRRNPVVVISGDHVVCENLNSIANQGNISLIAWVDGVAEMGATYRWYESGQWREDVTGFHYNQNWAYSTDPYIFTVEVIQDNGCSAFSEPFEVMVNKTPVVNITATEDIICENGTVTLTANLDDYNDGMQTYQWYTNAVNSSSIILGATQLEYTTTLTETTTFYFEVTQLTSGCKDTNSYTITVNDLPVITSITATETALCEGAPITLTANVEGGVTGGEVFTWYRNGELIEGANLQTYTEYPVTIDSDSASYVYNVYVTQTASGCTSILDPNDEVVVTVYANPTIAIEGDPIVCNDDEDNITLIANLFPLEPASGSFTYQWFEDNSPIDGQTEGTMTITKPYRDYAYNFHVIAFNNFGCTMSSDVFQVLVNNTIVSNITATEDIICKGGTVTLTAHLNDWNADQLVYQWFKSVDGDEYVLIDGATSLTYTTTLDQTTTFKFEVDQLTSLCTDNNTYKITVNDLPVITSITHSELSICEGAPITLTANVEGGVEGGEVFTWYRNGEVIPGAYLQTYTEYPATFDSDITEYVYNVTVKQTASGCESILDPNDEVTLIVKPNPTIAIEGDPIVCTDDENNIVLVAHLVPVEAASGTYNFQWFEDNDAITGQNESTMIITKPYRDYPYNFHVVAFNEFGCTVSSDVFNVNVNNSVLVNITATEDDICKGGTVTLTAHLGDWNADQLVYQWYTVELENEIEVVTPIPGATSLTYTTTLDNTTHFRFVVDQLTSLCQGYNDYTINVHDIPVITEIEHGALTICEGAAVTLTAIVEGGVTGGEVFTWYRNGDLIEGANLQTYTEYPTTVDFDVVDYTYNVYVTQTASGCISILNPENEVTVTVQPNPTIAIEGDPIVCNQNDDNIMLVAHLFPTEAASGIYTFQWFEDNAAIEGQTDDTMFLTKPYRDYPYNFHVEVFNEYGCSVSSDLFYAYVNDAPVVNIFASETDICVDGSVTLTAALNDWNADQLVYQWYANGDLVEGATELTYTTNLDVNTEFSLVVTQLTSGCVATSNIILVNVNPRPVIASIELDKTQLCTGGQVTVTAVIDPEFPGVEGSPYTFTWFRNGILMDGITGISFTESPVAFDDDFTTYYYTAYVTQVASGCYSDEVSSDIITVYANPRVMISGDHHICETDSVFLIANVDDISAAVGILSYTWYEHGQERDNMAYFMGNSQFFSEYFYASENPYIFTVEVTREDGCTTMSEPFELFVYPQPVVNITSTEMEICEGGEVTLTAHLNDYNAVNLVYQWFTVETVEYESEIGYDEEGNIITETITEEIEHIIPGATELTYTGIINTTVVYGFRVVQTISGCEATDIITIDVVARPVVDSITVDVDDVCEGAPITFTAHISGGVTGGEVFTWYKDGVEIPGAYQQTYTEYLSAVDGDVSQYTYNAIVTQAASGCISILNPDVAVTVTVRPNPVVFVEGDPIVCTDTENNITLIAHLNPTEPVSGEFTYQWYENNVAIEDAVGETLYMTKPYSENPYNFHVIVSNEFGCSVASEMFYVYVNENPVVTITATETEICTGGQITLTAALNDWNADQLTYQWYANGDVIVGATSLTYTTTVDEPTIYSFTVNQLTSGCNATSNEITVNVYDRPELEISVDLNTICDGGQITLTAEILNPESAIGTPVYTWYRNGYIVPGAVTDILIDSPLAIDGDLTPYTYKATVQYSAAGCLSDNSNTVVVNVNPTPVVAISIEGNPTICEGGDVTLIANVTPADEDLYTYQWYRDNVLMTDETESTLVLTALEYRETAYQYHVVVTSHAGCEVVSDIYDITIVRDPIVAVTVDQNIICEGGVATFTAHVEGGVGPFSYAWYSNYAGDNVVLSTLPTCTTLATDPANNYSYWVVVTSPYGCETTTYYNEFSIVADPDVVIAVANGYDQAVCDGGSTMLVANVTGGHGQTYYQWYKNGNILPGETNQVLMTGELLYGVANAFTVHITQDGVGCESWSEAFNVPVMLAPTVAITGNMNTCEGGTVTMTADVTMPEVDGNVLTYQWYRVFDGNITPIHNATNSQYTTDPLTLANSYEYFVEVTSSISGCSIFTSGTVQANVVADPAVVIQGAHVVCQGGDLTLNAYVTGGVEGDAYVYEWSWVSGLITGTATTNVPQFTLPTDLAANDAATPYYFTVHIYRNDNTGCDAISAAFEVNILAVPVPVVTMNYDNICMGGEVLFTANVVPVGTYNYDWYVNGVVVGYQEQLTYSNFVLGANEIYVVVTPTGLSSSCIAQSTPVTLTVHADPVVTIVNLGNDGMCIGGTANVSVGTITLNPAVQTGIYTYQWSVNGFEVSNAIMEGFQQTLTEPGTYTYRLRVIMDDAIRGCASTWSSGIDVTVAPQPVVQIVRTDEFSHLDVCEGGEITIAASTTNTQYAAVYGTTSYAWHTSGAPNGSTGTTFTKVLNEVGHQYQFTALGNFAGEACGPVTSNVITVNVNNKPSWTDVHVVTTNDGNVCESERVFLYASIQGGVVDPVDNPNGIIQWRVNPEVAPERVVTGGVGATSWDDPTDIGYHDYFVTYANQIGAGCELADYYVVNENVEGHTLIVHERPTVEFTDGDGSIICANNSNNAFAALELTFTGTPPFYFNLDNMTTGASETFGPIYTNPFTTNVQPSVSSIYRISGLYDAHCEASADLESGVYSVVVYVSDIDVPSFFTTDCEAEETEGYYIKHLPIDIISGNPTNYTVTYVNSDYSEFNLSGNISATYPWGSTIEIHLPKKPGDYKLEIEIEGCKYSTIGRVLVDGANLGGADLIEQRWNDVLVVNNNSEVNGGFIFYSYQWYRDGQIIDGAEGQYYRQPGKDGLNGSYHVVLNGYAIMADGEQVPVTFVTCPFTPTFEYSVKVYPVPAHSGETITIEIDLPYEQLNGAVLDIYDAKGAHVQTITTVTNKTLVKGITTQGTYFGRITTGTNEIEPVKFVIVK